MSRELRTQPQTVFEQINRADDIGNEFWTVTFNKNK
ncbi:MAG: hypothetical protein UZ17_ACD001001254 [Acidobacteria bacterium OLB17]|nr:MAG: hypothetical protein UZ17_ACD001001254 [Acidobacteria bacterium OLB17]